MKTITSVSGGKTSAYLAANYPTDYNIFALVRTNDKECLYPDKKLRQVVEDKIQKPFIGTLEDDVIITTMLELEQYLGRKIDWVSGPTFDELIDLKGGFLPNQFSRYCTQEMKTIPIATWLYQNKLNPAKMSFGFRVNEQKRAKTMLSKLNKDGFVEVKIKVGKHKNGKNKWAKIPYVSPFFPLIENGINKDTVNNYWFKKPVKFAWMNNCVGCFHTNPILLNRKFEKDPVKMNWFLNKEIETGNTFKTDLSYTQIKNWKSQHDLFDEDFNDCDSGYCGL